MSDKKQPIETFRHNSGRDRNVSIPVWENESNGKTWLAAGQAQLQYKDDGEWKTSTSLSVPDLLAQERCIIDAIAFIHFAEMKAKRELEQAA